MVNEDIIYTLADFNLDNQIGDPRDEFKPTYRGLHLQEMNILKDMLVVITTFLIT